MDNFALTIVNMVSDHGHDTGQSEIMELLKYQTSIINSLKQITENKLEQIHFLYILLTIETVIILLSSAQNIWEKCIKTFIQSWLTLIFQYAHQSGYQLSFKNEPPNISCGIKSEHFNKAENSVVASESQPLIINGNEDIDLSMGKQTYNGERDESLLATNTDIFVHIDNNMHISESRNSSYRNNSNLTDTDNETFINGNTPNNITVINYDTSNTEQTDCVTDKSNGNQPISIDSNDSEQSYQDDTQTQVKQLVSSILNKSEIVSQISVDEDRNEQIFAESITLSIGSDATLNFERQSIKDSDYTDVSLSYHENKIDDEECSNTLVNRKGRGCFMNTLIPKAHQNAQIWFADESDTACKTAGRVRVKIISERGECFVGSVSRNGKPANKCLTNLEFYLHEDSTDSQGATYRRNKFPYDARDPHTDSCVQCEEHDNIKASNENHGNQCKDSQILQSQSDVAAAECNNLTHGKGSEYGFPDEEVESNLFEFEGETIYKGAYNTGQGRTHSEAYSDHVLTTSVAYHGAEETLRNQQQQQISDDFCYDLSIDGRSMGSISDTTDTNVKSPHSEPSSQNHTMEFLHHQNLPTERQSMVSQSAPHNAQIRKEEFKNVLGIDLRVDDLLPDGMQGMPFNLGGHESYQWNNLPSEHYEDIDFDGSGVTNPILRQRNRPIYEQLKQIDFVMGYFSTGQSIDVFVNLDGLDQDFYLQQICQITGQPPSKFHIKDNNENWSLGNI